MGKRNKGDYYEINPNNKLGLNLRELVSHWELLYFFAWRDIKVKYKQTLLGFLWALLQPTIMMGIFTLFVKGGLKIDSGGMNYSVFSFSGFLLWTIFSSGLNNAGNSMVNSAHIIKKIYFPRIILPTSSIVVNVFDFLMGFIPFTLLLIVLRQPVDLWSALVFWPLGLLVAVLSTMGLGCLLAALNVKYRDFRHATPFIVQVLLFVSPVIYSTSTVKSVWVQYGVALNPMYAALAFFRAPMSPVAIDWGVVGVSLASCIALLWVGLAYFRRTEIYFADLA